MIIQKHLFKCFILLLSVCPVLVSAKVYNCALKVGDVQEEFIFDVVKNQKGFGGSFSNYVYFLFMKKDQIAIKVQHSKDASQFQSNHSLTQDEIEISATPGWTLTCKAERLVKETSTASPAPKVKKLVLDDDTPLEEFKADISFTTTNSMKVKYNVSTAKQRMRAIIFQKGRLYSTDDDVKRDLNGNWCIFQVKLELDQDTLIDEGHNWQTVQYKTLDNSSSHTVYAYSFIDPAQGKVSQKFKRYIPFNLACQVRKGEIFNRKLWRQITGDRIKLYYNP